ncbi:AMP-binding protein, partial [Thalassospira sp. UBA4513]
MSANVYPVPDDIAKGALIDKAKYDAMYKQSVEDPEGFWGEHGKRIDWIKPYKTVKNVSYDAKDLYIKWYEDGTLNVAANCLDRHLEKRGDQTAIIFEGDDPNVSEHITYRDLYERTCRFANALKSMGVAKGDRVVIYLPMIPEAAVAMLACARIGAIHSIVFGGFSPEALAGRVEDCGAKVVITSDEGLRGGRSVPLKRNADEALSHPGVKSVEKMVVVKHTGKDVAWNDARDVWYHEVCAAASTDCPPTEVNAEDPLFVLYTSGSTG